MLLCLFNISETVVTCIPEQQINHLSIWILCMINFLPLREAQWTGFRSEKGNSGWKASFLFQMITCWEFAEKWVCIVLLKKYCWLWYICLVLYVKLLWRYLLSIKTSLPVKLLLLPSPQDMIHIADTKVARRYGDFFIRQIHKFEEVSINLASCWLSPTCCPWMTQIHSSLHSWIEHWRRRQQPAPQPRLGAPQADESKA